MSEGAQEARNKDFKYSRLHNSRKCSRVSTNKDVIHNLLISSDPFITGLRPQWTASPQLELVKKAKKMSPPRATIDGHGVDDDSVDLD